MTANGQPRTTTAILEDALHEMHERERRLQPFVDELADVRKGIKTIEKALDAGGGSATRASAARSGPPMGDEIVRHLGEAFDPLTKDDIAEKLGTKLGLHVVLASLVKSGRIVQVEGGYGLPVPVSSTED